MEFDMTRIVEEIAMQAKENQEEFIFETIHPYCENVLQMKINKEELKQILLNSIQKQPSEDYISREEVIKHLENITMDTNPDNYDNKDKWYQANGFNLCKVGIEMYVKNLPSVTPKTKSEDKNG